MVCAMYGPSWSMRVSVLRGGRNQGVRQGFKGGKGEEGEGWKKEKEKAGKETYTCMISSTSLSSRSPVIDSRTWRNGFGTERRQRQRRKPPVKKEDGTDDDTQDLDFFKVRAERIVRYDPARGPEHRLDPGLLDVGVLGLEVIGEAEGDDRETSEGRRKKRGKGRREGEKGKWVGGKGESEKRTHFM